MIYIGVDPGQKGALAVVYQDGFPGPNCVMPGAARDLWDLLDYLVPDLQDEDGGVRVALERVHSMPHQGVASSFTFGVGYGVVQGVLAAKGWPVELVTPQVWKKKFGLGSDKQDARDLARQLFPRAELKPARARVVHEGIAEAYLIAEWLRRREQGK